MPADANDIIKNMTEYAFIRRPQDDPMCLSDLRTSDQHRQLAGSFRSTMNAKSGF